MSEPTTYGVPLCDEYPACTHCDERVRRARERAAEPAEQPSAPDPYAGNPLAARLGIEMIDAAPEPAPPPPVAEQPVGGGAPLSPDLHEIATVGATHELDIGESATVVHVRDELDESAVTVVGYDGRAYTLPLRWWRALLAKETP